VGDGAAARRCAAALALHDELMTATTSRLVTTVVHFAGSLCHIGAPWAVLETV
jgi:hypothetical protein